MASWRHSDWPAAPWYGYTFRLAHDKVAGVAVLNHPGNPPSLWYNHRDARMLNPCIVAPTELTLKALESLLLHYRVVVHDGPTPRDLLNRFYTQWTR